MVAEEKEERTYVGYHKSRLKELAQPKTFYDSRRLQYPIKEDAQATIRPIFNKTLTYKPSTRLLELACPKWPYFIYYGTEAFRFIRRDHGLTPEKHSFGPENILGFMPTLKQIEITRPTAITFFPFTQTKKEKRPRLVTFRSLSEKRKEICPKRISILAQPRQNNMEIRKKQIEKAEKIYTVSKSALRAIPSPRTIALAKPKRDLYYQKQKPSTTKSLEQERGRGIRIGDRSKQKSEGKDLKQHNLKYSDQEITTPSVKDIRKKVAIISPKIQKETRNIADKIGSEIKSSESVSSKHSERKETDTTLCAKGIAEKEIKLDREKERLVKDITPVETLGRSPSIPRQQPKPQKQKKHHTAVPYELSNGKSEATQQKKKMVYETKSASRDRLKVKSDAVEDTSIQTKHMKPDELKDRYETSEKYISGGKEKVKKKKKEVEKVAEFDDEAVTVKYIKDKELKEVSRTRDSTTGEAIESRYMTKKDFQPLQITEGDISSEETKRQGKENGAKEGALKAKLDDKEIALKHVKNKEFFQVTDRSRVQDGIARKSTDKDMLKGKEIGMMKPDKMKLAEESRKKEITLSDITLESNIIDDNNIDVQRETKEDKKDRDKITADILHLQNGSADEEEKTSSFILDTDEGILQKTNLKEMAKDKIGKELLKTCLPQDYTLSQQEMDTSIIHDKNITKDGGWKRKSINKDAVMQNEYKWQEKLKDEGRKPDGTHESISSISDRDKAVLKEEKFKAIAGDKADITKQTKVTDFPELISGEDKGLLKGGRIKQSMDEENIEKYKNDEEQAQLLDRRRISDDKYDTAGSTGDQDSLISKEEEMGAITPDKASIKKQTNIDEFPKLTVGSDYLLKEEGLITKPIDEDVKYKKDKEKIQLLDREEALVDKHDADKNVLKEGIKRKSRKSTEDNIAKYKKDDKKTQLSGKASDDKDDSGKDLMKEGGLKRKSMPEQYAEKYKKDDEQAHLLGRKKALDEKHGTDKAQLKEQEAKTKSVEEKDAAKYKKDDEEMQLLEVEKALNGKHSDALKEEAKRKSMDEEDSAKCKKEEKTELLDVEKAMDEKHKDVTKEEEIKRKSTDEENAAKYKKEDEQAELLGTEKVIDEKHKDLPKEEQIKRKATDVEGTAKYKKDEKTELLGEEKELDKKHKDLPKEEIKRKSIDEGTAKYKKYEKTELLGEEKELDKKHKDLSKEEIKRKSMDEEGTAKYKKDEKTELLGEEKELDTKHKDLPKEEEIKRKSMDEEAAAKYKKEDKEAELLGTEKVLDEKHKDLPKEEEIKRKSMDEEDAAKYKKEDKQTGLLGTEKALDEKHKDLPKEEEIKRKSMDEEDAAKYKKEGEQVVLLGTEKVLDEKHKDLPKEEEIKRKSTDEEDAAKYKKEDEQAELLGTEKVLDEKQKDLPKEEEIKRKPMDEEGTAKYKKDEKTELLGEEKELDEKHKDLPNEEEIKRKTINKEDIAKYKKKDEQAELSEVEKALDEEHQDLLKEEVKRKLTDEEDAAKHKKKDEWEESVEVEKRLDEKHKDIPKGEIKRKSMDKEEASKYEKEDVQAELSEVEKALDGEHWDLLKEEETKRKSIDEKSAAKYKEDEQVELLSTDKAVDGKHKDLAKGEIKIKSMDKEKAAKYERKDEQTELLDVKKSSDEKHEDLQQEGEVKIKSMEEDYHKEYRTEDEQAHLLHRAEIRDDAKGDISDQNNIITKEEKFKAIALKEANISEQTEFKKLADLIDKSEVKNMELETSANAIVDIESLSKEQNKLTHKDGTLKRTFQELIESKTEKQDISDMEESSISIIDETDKDMLKGEIFKATTPEEGRIAAQEEILESDVHIADDKQHLTGEELSKESIREQDEKFEDQFTAQTIPSSVTPETAVSISDDKSQIKEEKEIETAIADEVYKTKKQASEDQRTHVAELELPKETYISASQFEESLVETLGQATTQIPSTDIKVTDILEQKGGMMPVEDKKLLSEISGVKHTISSIEEIGKEKEMMSPEYEDVDTKKEGIEYNIDSDKQVSKKSKDQSECLAKRKTLTDKEKIGDRKERKKHPTVEKSKKLKFTTGAKKQMKTFDKSMCESFKLPLKSKDRADRETIEKLMMPPVSHGREISVKTQGKVAKLEIVKKLKLNKEEERKEEPSSITIVPEPEREDLYEIDKEKMEKRELDQISDLSSETPSELSYIVIEEEAPEEIKSTQMEEHKIVESPKIKQSGTKEDETVNIILPPMSKYLDEKDKKLIIETPAYSTKTKEISTIATTSESNIEGKQQTKEMLENVVTIYIKKGICGRKLSYLTPPPPRKVRPSDRFSFSTAEESETF